MAHPTTSAPDGLERRRTEALMQLLLSDEPGVHARQGPQGCVFAARPSQSSPAEGLRFFAVATDGGVLVRLSKADGERYRQVGSVVGNAAFPDWVHQMGDLVARETNFSVAFVLGDPHQWVWLPLRDEHGFAKRRPLVLEALAFARHRLSDARQGATDEA